MIIYLLTFYLFDDIEKNIEIIHANQSETSNAILTKMLVQLNVYIFYLRFVLGITMMIVVTEKHQNQLFYSSKISFFGR